MGRIFFDENAIFNRIILYFLPEFKIDWFFRVYDFKVSNFDEVVKGIINRYNLFDEVFYRYFSKVLQEKNSILKYFGLNIYIFQYKIYFI